MNYDRFSCEEEIKWHPEAESQGRIARLNGFLDAKNKTVNPYEWNSYMWKSFCAGWVDADQAILNKKII